MKLIQVQIADSLNKAFQKQSLKRSNIELLKTELTKVFNYIDDNQDEDYHKNIISDFLKAVYYRDKYIINVNKKQDLVIRLGNSTKDNVGILLEFKKPSETRDMISFEKPNSKAFQQLLFYYLRERIDNNNHSIKHLIATNFFEWYIFDEVWFEKNIFRNTKLINEYEEFKLSGHDTKFFYEQIAAKYIDLIDKDLECTYFNLKDYQQLLNPTGFKNPSDLNVDDTKLINLYKILSPEHLLKLPYANDSNQLNKEFYDELLHILGLEEVKNGSKRTIERIQKDKNEGSLIENTIQIILSRKKLQNIENIESFGDTTENQIYSIGLELCITWLNRILFLKLLEGQLVKYHKGNLNYTFLNSQKIRNFDELEELFFDVLAIPIQNRIKHINEKFGNLPYLNSSLFEITDLEDDTIRISEIKSRLEMPIFSSTVLKDKNEKRKTGSMNTLQYLFEFLNSFNFSSEDTAEIQEENKTIISASVLGLIFEKLNGYKDGSFFTPGFITMYICRETLRRAVVQKFNDANLPNFKNMADFEELKESIDFKNKQEREKANQIINSLRICDPAVGSGHFLVSALNEIIAIKSELQILSFADGSRIKQIDIIAENDELIITDQETKEHFSYHVSDKHTPIKELQQLQETLFNEKRIIIENCLFGVDINPKSVMICRLRLWIELLKNAYYTAESNYLQLETFPNIDINIKSGNSLISKFDNGLNIFERAAILDLIKEYKINVNEYKNCTDYNRKDNIKKQINRLKTELEKFAIPQDKSYREFLAKQKEFELLKNVNWSNGQVKEKMITLSAELLELETKYLENYKKVYFNSFEWAIEFPEILSDDGNFTGFNVVIGNPPYIGIEDIKADFRRFYETIYKTATGRFDLYSLFIEKVTKIINNKGTFGFIIPGKFLNNKQFVAARKLISNNHHSVNVAEIEEKVFNEAQVNSAIVIYYYETERRVYKAQKISKSEIINISNVPIASILQDKENIFKIDINEINENLLKKIEIGCKKIKEIGEVRDGIVAGLLKDILFVETKKNKNSFPLYFGKNVQRYKILESQTFVDYRIEFMKEQEFIRKQGSEPGLRMRKPEIFEREKILTRFVAKEIIAAFDGKNRYYEHTLHSTYIFDEKFKSKYVLSLFNSRLFKFYYQKTYSNGGNIFPQVRIASIENLPIKIIDLKTQDKIIEIVDKILIEKQNNTNSDTTILENQIDNLVYKIYDLTPEEIKIVEHATT